VSKVKEMLEALEKELRQNKQYSAADKLLPIIEEAGKNDWIPCSERLPEESGLYLCTTYRGNVMDLDYSKKHKAFNSFDTDREPNLKIEVKAWMPPPETYKGE
jgi:hypothetical protein